MEKRQIRDNKMKVNDKKRQTVVRKNKVERERERQDDRREQKV